MHKKSLSYKLTLISRSVGGKRESVFVMLPTIAEMSDGPLDTTGRPSVTQEQVQKLFKRATEGRTVSYD